MYELDMVNRVCEHLKSQGLSVVTEVPFMQQSIDMVFEREDKLFAIEFKVGNWKRALEQASNHFVGTDEVYICIPKPKNGITQKLIDAINTTNIGLLLFDDNNDTLIETVYPASYNREVWKVGNTWLRMAFDNRMHGVWA